MTSQQRGVIAILKKRVQKDEGITHVEGDAEQVVIVAAEVVNAGVSVSTVEPKTPPTTTTTNNTYLEDMRCGENLQDNKEKQSSNGEEDVPRQKKIKNS
ncbi:hypothetical protein Tco_0505141 [Tanacetum coccineum]